MGSASSAFDNNAGPTLAIPEGYVTPPFPSLYRPSFWAGNEQVGIFLYDAEGIWRYTTYWTLITVCGTFFIASLIATFNLFLSLTIFRPAPPTSKPGRPITPEPYLQPPSTPRHAGPDQPNPPTPQTPHSPSAPLVQKKTRSPPRRPPLWPLVLIPLGAVALAAGIAVVSATVIGFALAAVYSAGGFSMSTWVPFLWGVIQVLVLIISSYSTLTSIL